MPPDEQRKLAAIIPLSGTDMVGYGALSQRNDQLAEVYAYRGEKDRAFEWLERAHRQRDPGLASLRIDPFLANLQGDPRWNAFLRTMGLADDQLK